MKHLKKALALILIASMAVSNGSFSVFAEEIETKTEIEDTSVSLNESGTYANTTISEITMGTRPDSGSSTGNPFKQGNGGSNSFRIPALVTLDDGTLVAAADARWNTTYDGGGLDTMTAYSTDNGANWTYQFTNYLGDNGNEYNGSSSTAFIDPALATDGTSVYMLCDLYPYGIALNGSGNTAPSTETGFNSNGKLLLASSGSSSYDYYLDGTVIKDASGNTVDGYTVDEYFNITTSDGTSSNLFFENSPYKVQRTGYLYLVKSKDGGKTWSAPSLITGVKTSNEQACLVGPGRGIISSNYGIVFPVYKYNGSTDSQVMGFIYSSNGGTTWTRVDSSISWSSESAVVELSDGTLRFFFRNGSSKLKYVDYKDGAWKSEVNTNISTNSNTQISAIKLSGTVNNQQVIAVSCPTGKNEGGSSDSSASSRLNGKIFIGYVGSDGTMTWDNSISVTEGNTQFMYSCLSELKDDNSSTVRLGILYEDCENAWGTGTDCYYTMSYKTYDTGITLDSTGGSDDTPEYVITDETTSVKVDTTEQNQALTNIQVEETTTNAVSTDYVAYEVTINGGAYTGQASVTVPLSETLQALDADKLCGFVVNTDGTVTEVSGTKSDDNKNYTFVCPHFSVVGVKALDETSSTEYNKVPVSLMVGETEDYIIKDEDNGDDTISNSYAEIIVDGTTTEESISSSKADKLSLYEAGTYIIGNGTQYLKLEGNSLSSTTDIDQATKWEVSGNNGSIQIKSGEYYLNISSSRNGYSLSVGTSASNSYNWSYSADNGFYYAGRWNTYYLNWSSSAWNLLSSPNNYTWAYTYTEGESIPESKSTKVTITGIAEGDTEVLVGSTLYQISVQAPVYENTKSVLINKSFTLEPTVPEGGSVSYTVKEGANLISMTGGTVTTGSTTGTAVVEATVKNTAGNVVAKYKYTLTISDVTEIIENSISVEKTRTKEISVDLEEGQTVEWSVEDPSIAGVAAVYDQETGSYGGTASVVGNTVSSEGTTVIGTVKDANGNIIAIHYWNVTVTELSGSTTYTMTMTYTITKVEHTTVYYCINGGELIEITDENTTVDGNGNRVLSVTNTSPYGTNIMFFAKPDDGYALTYMYSGTGFGDYYCLSDGNPDGTGSGAWPFNDPSQDTIPTANNDSAWKTVENSTGTSLHGFRWALLEGELTISSMKNMFSRAISLGCDGAMTFTKSKTTQSFSADIAFVSQKLPDVTKSIVSISRNGIDTTYTSGMNVELGDTINYQINVTKYATNETYGTITYSNDSLTDVLTNNSGISYQSMGTTTSSDVPYAYTTSLTLSLENYGDVVTNGEIVNTAELKYSYKSKYSNGTLDKTASVKAEGIRVNIPEYVVDFGLPISIDLGDILGGLTVTGGEAQYGKVSGSGTTVTYIPDKVLADVDYVTVNLSNGNSYGVRIFPASTVYYDEGFAVSSGFTGGAIGTTAQTAQKAGESTDEYGFDSAYASVNKGNAAESVTKGDTETFSFTGTGVDIYMNSTSTSGNISVQIRDAATNKLVKVATVRTVSASDLYADYNGKDEFGLVAASYTGLAHGNYTVKITNTSENGTGVFFDGFRVYNTLQPEPEFYKTDKEDSPLFIELRDQVLAALNVTESDENSYNMGEEVIASADESIEAVILNDGSYVNNADAVLNDGPKNEVFLLPGEAVSFKIDTNREVQVGLKVVAGQSTTYAVNKINKGTIASATDMFYTVLNAAETESEQQVLIENTGNGLLSITQIKICDDPEAAIASLTADDINAAIKMFLEKTVDPSEPEVEEPILADCTLTLNLVDYTGSVKAVTSINANGPVGENETFAAADIQAAAEEILPDGYGIADVSAIEDCSLAYGEDGTYGILVGKTAALNITYKKGSKVVGTATLIHVQTSKDKKTIFSTSEIKAAAPEGYSITSLRETSVNYGSSKSINAICR